MGLDFQPRLGVLPAPQRWLWDEFARMPSEFVLYGETALALHLGHRTSVDFDFFGDRAFEPAKLASTLPFLTGATITQQEPNTLSVSVDRDGPVKDALLNDCRIDLPAALVGAREIYGPLFNPQLTLKALSFFGDGNLHRLPRDVQDRLARAAREVDLDALPELADLVRSFEQDLSTKP
jgi:hypothetical protein